MGLIDFFRDPKIQKVAKGESRIVKCKKCHVVFKLVNSIPVKDGKIKCPKCKVPIKAYLPDTPHLFPDVELEIDQETMDKIYTDENEKGNINSESMKNSEHKIQEITKGESGIVKCEKCQATFKLIDSIPVKEGKIKCPKCKVPIKVNLPDTPHLFPDVELEIDPETMDKIYTDIERYFISKNEKFQTAIMMVCAFHKIKNMYDVKETIDRLSVSIALSQDEIKIAEKEGNYEAITDNIEQIEEAKNKIKFFEDILNFHNYFSKKGFNITCNQIKSIFNDVAEKHSKEKRELQTTELYDIIRKRVVDRKSKHEIVKEFFKYYLEIGEFENLTLDFETGTLKKHKTFAPNNIIWIEALLKKFGIPVKEDDSLFEGELYQFCIIVYNELVDELVTESFENSFNSSYEELTNDWNDSPSERISISSNVKREVWRRDQGRCARCGSRENLEYDHIIPVAKGGSNTARNIELLCQECNRKKSDKIM